MALRQKFATQVNADLLAETKALAEAEGRQIQSLVEEALSDLLAKRRGEKPRASVMEAYRAGVREHGPLYERFAK